MSRLAPNLFERRFGDLVQIGRSRLPSLAPAWTDHNAHDPGITLIELLAWVSEAQLYSLSRTRRDERAAYAALMGIAPHGTRPSSGLIWPDPQDPESPTGQRSLALATKAAARMAGTESPVFRASHRRQCDRRNVGTLVRFQSTQFSDERIAVLARHVYVGE